MTTQKTALVTGAGQGIGQGIALHLAAQGIHVFANDYRIDALDETITRAASSGTKVTALPFDVSAERQVEEAVGTIPRIDYLVNNAGICPHVPDQEMSEELWDRIFSINVKGTYFCIKFAAEKMKAFQAGSIVNISSGASKTGGVHVSIPYSASKAAINSITFSFAKKLAPYGIRVNGVAPGFIDSRILREMPIQAEQLTAEIPLQRLGTPQDVAESVSFLLSERASFITGEMLDVNGGDIMD
jgi:3-oxoacyl-[acyl-carrier protein] reductase